MFQKKIIVANWKMNPLSIEDARASVSATRRFEKKLRKTDIVICPPLIYLEPISRLIKKSRHISLGAQDVFWNISGAYTGEISPLMVYNAGGRYAIIGHSERRNLGETDEIISKKVNLALKAGLSVILCVGERERDGQGLYLGVLRNMLRGGLVGVSKKSLRNLLVAYEPVFAIGKAEEDALKPEEVEAMVIFIKKTLADLYGQDDAKDVRILYGGSVGPDNAARIVQDGGVHGLLIGRQSLAPEHFKSILAEVDRL